MPDLDGRSGLDQVLGKRCHHAVRARDDIPALQEKTGDCGKTAATNADKMNLGHNTFLSNKNDNDEDETNQNGEIDAGFS